MCFVSHGMRNAWNDWKFSCSCQQRRPIQEASKSVSKELEEHAEAVCYKFFICTGDAFYKLSEMNDCTPFGQHISKM